MFSVQKCSCNMYMYSHGWSILTHILFFILKSVACILMINDTILLGQNCCFGNKNQSNKKGFIRYLIDDGKSFCKPRLFTLLEGSRRSSLLNMTSLASGQTARTFSSPINTITRKELWNIPVVVNWIHLTTFYSVLDVLKS